MAVIDVGRFAASRDQVALRVAYDRLPGLLRKRLEVPADTVALLRKSDRSVKVAPAGSVETDFVDGVLVRTSTFPLEPPIEGLLAEDGLDVSVNLKLEVRVRPSEVDLQQLERELLGAKETLSLGDLVRHFAPFVREAARFFCSKKKAEALVTADQRLALEQHLKAELQKPCFEAGVELVSVAPPSFHSAAFKAIKQREAEKKVAAEEIVKEKQLEELRLTLEKANLLKDIEARDELDQKRKEMRLRRYEEVRGKMGEDDLKALIMLLEDDDQKAELIKELIDKQATPEQRGALKVSEMEQKLEARLRELQLKLAALQGGEIQSDEQDPITRRIHCVIGKRVLAFDPGTNLHPEVPKEVYDTESGGLGYLRSVRAQRLSGTGETVFAGAQRGVYRIEADRKLEYVFPTEPEGKGGANAVAYFDGRIYATHSEMGLVEWPLEGGEKKGRFICKDATAGQTSTRGAMIGPDGRLYFSAGNDVFALDVATGADRAVRYKGSDDSITSFCLSRKELLAGNKNGRIYRWDLDDPGSPDEFPVKKSNPIYMIRPTRIAGQHFYVIGSKDYTVTAAAPEKDLYREYHAREEIRWVDAAGDFVTGVSRAGYKVFCWDVRKQSEPVLTIRVSDKVQDIFVVKERPKARA